MSHLSITTDGQLAEYCRRLAACPWIAFDTEFVSERTYRPVLCLVQVATPDGLALIDAMQIDDMSPLWRTIVEGEHETIVHAGRSEMEFCHQAVGRVSKELFDVQIAAGLVGIEYPAGFRTLIVNLLGETAKKQETRTDWRRRPLSDRQIEYALDDVRYLPPMRDALHSRLESLGRLAWLEEEMTTWLEEVQRSFTEERWMRVSGNSGLSPKSLAIVRELWRWRESEAGRQDRPIRHVFRDDLIIELAKRQTADLKRIKAVRGLDRGDLKRLLPKIAESIARALELPESQWPSKPGGRQVAQLAVVGQFLFAALGSICRAANLAPALVGTPNDIRELIAYRTGHLKRETPPRLAHGWRAQIVGQLFDDLLAGKKAIRIGDPRSESPLVFDETAP